jgi:ribosomal protein S18 acetylase RimI-like enzyme
MTDVTGPTNRVPIEVAQVAAETPLFPQVVTLGNANSRTLGFFPRGAFLDAAVEGRIVAASDANQQVIGYVLYRTADQRGLIVHLCVDRPHRGRGIANRWLNHVPA